MLSSLLFVLICFGIWTSIIIFRKGPNEKKIRTLLNKMGINAIKMVDILTKLVGNFKELFLLLTHNEFDKSLDANNSLDVSNCKEDAPKLLQIKNKDAKKVA